MFKLKKPEFGGGIANGGLTEAGVLNAVSQFLSVHGIFHYRNNTGAYKIKDRFIRYGFPGSSDIAGVCPDGRALYVECKKPGGRLSALQREFLEKINSLGGGRRRRGRGRLPGKTTEGTRGMFLFLL
jgi:hypothetical protein